jgi:hypothetical protein
MDGVERTLKISIIGTQTNGSACTFWTFLILIVIMIMIQPIENKMQNAGKVWNEIQMQVEVEVTSVSCGNLYTALRNAFT